MDKNDYHQRSDKKQKTPVNERKQTGSNAGEISHCKMLVQLSFFLML